jgi:hypothetical protein
MSSEGFTNAVVGGAETLIRTAIKSFGYIAGVFGWRLARNGDAEFNDATIRGSLDVGGGRIVIDASTPAELVSYGINIAVLFHIFDAVTGLEDGYAFIGTSNVLDTGSKNVLLFGEVVYPVAGNPLSPTAADVRTHFQIDLRQTSGNPLKATVFKDEIVQFNSSVPHMNFNTPVVNINGSDFDFNTGSQIVTDAGANAFFAGQVSFLAPGSVFLGNPNASPGTTADTTVTNGTTSSTVLINTLATTGARGHVFVAPPSGSVIVWGSFGGSNTIAASYALGDFEIRTGGTPGAGTVFQNADPNSCSQVQSAIANSTITENIHGNVQGLNPGTTYNATLCYAAANGGGGVGVVTVNRRRVTVLPTL